RRARVRDQAAVDSHPGQDRPLAAEHHPGRAGGVLTQLRGDPGGGGLMAELEIRDLHVRAGDKEILRGLDLAVGKGEIHALMGPNGSGKSTLANVIMGHPGLEITEGQIIFKGEDITEADPDERARAGLFMAFQYPVAVPGVTVTKYLRMIINARREAGGEQPMKIKEFSKTAQEAMELVNIPRDFSSRYLNDGFSGGE